MKKGLSDFFKNFLGKKVESMEDSLYNSSGVEAEQVSSDADNMLEDAYIDSVLARTSANAQMKR